MLWANILLRLGVVRTYRPLQRTAVLDPTRKLRLHRDMRANLCCRAILEGDRILFGYLGDQGKHAVKHRLTDNYRMISLFSR